MVLNQVRRWRMVDFIGRVESFDAQLKAVLALAGIAYDFETPRMNEGPPPPFRYEEVVDDEIVTRRRASTRATCAISATASEATTK